MILPLLLTECVSRHVVKCPCIGNGRYLMEIEDEREVRLMTVKVAAVRGARTNLVSRVSA
jgi:hypothetical protein